MPPTATEVTLMGRDRDRDPLVEVDCHLAPSPAERDALETMVETVSEASRYTRHDVAETCATLSFYSFDLDDLLTAVPTITLFATRYGAPLGHVTGTLPVALVSWQRDPSDAGRLLAMVAETVDDYPVTAPDVLQALEHVGPVAVHHDLPLEYVLMLIGEVSQEGGHRDLRSRVEDRVCEKVFGDG